MSTESPDFFKSANLLLGRAREMVRDVKENLNSYFNSSPWVRFVEPDPDPDVVGEIVKYRLQEPFPERISLLASDAINNARHALDHAVNAASRAITGASELSKTYFPFASTEAELNNIIKSNCKNVPMEIVNVARSCKPFRGGDNALWALSRTAGFNKHSLLVPMGSLGDRFQIVPFEAQAYGPDGYFEIVCIWDWEKSELIAFKIGAGFKSKIPVEARILTRAIFSREVEILGGNEAGPTLDLLVNKSARAIREIEVETKRILLSRT